MIAILMIILGIINASCGACAIASGIIAGSMMESVVPGMGMFGWIIIAIGALSLLVGILYIAVGWGLWELKEWAWMAALIVIIISLVIHIANLALGNWFGIIWILIEIVMIIYLMTPEVKMAFGKMDMGPTFGSPPPGSPPPPGGAPPPGGQSQPPPPSQPPGYGPPPSPPGQYGRP